MLRKFVCVGFHSCPGVGARALDIAYLACPLFSYFLQLAEDNCYVRWNNRLCSFLRNQFTFRLNKGNFF